MKPPLNNLSLRLKKILQNIKLKKWYSCEKCSFEDTEQTKKSVISGILKLQENGDQRSCNLCLHLQNKLVCYIAVNSSS